MDSARPCPSPYVCRGIFATAAPEERAALHGVAQIARRDERPRGKRREKRPGIRGGQEGTPETPPRGRRRRNEMEQASEDEGDGGGRARRSGKGRTQARRADRNQERPSAADPQTAARTEWETCVPAPRQARNTKQETGRESKRHWEQTTTPTAQEEGLNTALPTSRQGVAIVEGYVGGLG